MDEVEFLEVSKFWFIFSFILKIQADITELQQLLTTATRRNVRNCLASEINKMETMLKRKQAELVASEKSRISSTATNLPLNKIHNYGKAAGKYWFLTHAEQKIKISKIKIFGKNKKTSIFLRLDGKMVGRD